MGHAGTVIERRLLQPHRLDAVDRDHVPAARPRALAPAHAVGIAMVGAKCRVAADAPDQQDAESGQGQGLGAHVAEHHQHADGEQAQLPLQHPSPGLRVDAAPVGRCAVELGNPAIAQALNHRVVGDREQGIATASLFASACCRGLDVQAAETTPGQQPGLAHDPALHLVAPHVMLHTGEQAAFVGDAIAGFGQGKAVVAHHHHEYAHHAHQQREHDEAEHGGQGPAQSGQPAHRLVEPPARQPGHRLPPAIRLQLEQQAEADADDHPSLVAHQPVPDQIADRDPVYRRARGIRLGGGNGRWNIVWCGIGRWRRRARVGALVGANPSQQIFGVAQRQHLHGRFRALVAGG